MYNVKYFDNDLFYTCSLIEYISRKTLNRNSTIVNNLGIDGVGWIYLNAEVNHCLSLEQVANEVIEEYKIENGQVDIVSNCDVVVPTCFDMGKVYMRLILNTLDYEYTASNAETNNKSRNLIEHLADVYNSWICDTIDCYDNLMFTLNPEYHYMCFQAKELLPE